MLNIFWFRKDLRLEDNKGLKAFTDNITSSEYFLFLYIISKNSFKNYGEKRIAFLLQTLAGLKKDLKEKGFELEIVEGKSLNIFEIILGMHGSIRLFANKQVEPYCISRDEKLKKLLGKYNSSFNLFSDTTIFDKNEILKSDGQPYTVFTPFRNKALLVLGEKHYKEFNVNFNKLKKKKNIELNFPDSYDLNKHLKKISKSDKLKGGRSEAQILLKDFCEDRINNYKVARDYPGKNGTSLLSPYLHFGAINARECLRAVTNNKNESVFTWVNELIWREFYYYITLHFPHVMNGAFRKQYDNLNWNFDKKIFRAWCDGKTGYPLVDAGMRQLNSEGWMHNRLRMVTAMFLTKDLMIDWMWGEKYFAKKLIDFDFSSNNGGWQWSASTGCDAQPYFRIFNPITQSKKFDSEGNYIKKYVAELRNVPAKYIHQPSLMNSEEQKKYGVRIGIDYPQPIVNHSAARLAVLNMFNKMKK